MLPIVNQQRTVPGMSVAGDFQQSSGAEKAKFHSPGEFNENLGLALYDHSLKTGIVKSETAAALVPETHLPVIRG
ncbi:hypothetical protein DESUT3_08760 [Desulfuromonas versatilis]|uniref:Uncharacterized protein n=1 Tax=Desulfuromonas versatilis TaxID=2802975 RepID=A0ABM8HTK4_9BACT|nr:hypothetical protein [Desulfuromonas versatilis]BCR03807.1 hypothetical protein DESUT3_08760 [Desulfuromonas versatilis]